MLIPSSKSYFIHTFSCTIVVTGAIETHRSPIVRKTFDTRSLIKPMSNLDFYATIRLRGEPKGYSTTFNLEQPHKWERRHTFTLNLKTMSLWLISLIKYSTFTFLNDVRLLYSQLLHDRMVPLSDNFRFLIHFVLHEKY